MHDFDVTYLNRVSLIRPGILPKSYGLPDRPFQKIEPRYQKIGEFMLFRNDVWHIMKLKVVKESVG